MSAMPWTSASPSSSASTPATGERCAPWREPVPSIVAESLCGVQEPATLALDRPGEAAARAVAAALACAAAPPPAARGDAVWLRPGQRGTARRLVGVIERHGGALLADPVGSGKTFIALAVASVLGPEGSAAAIVPAPLVEQWQRRAAECGVPLEVLSHTAVSLGGLPAATTRLVIVDECHHFRHPATHRYRNLARFLVGRWMLGLSATPLVNRLDDLAHQLLLGIRDDALRSSGTPSLRQAMAKARIPAALGELIVTTPLPTEMPARREHRTPWSAGPDVAPPGWLTDLDALAISTRGGIAALIRCVLMTAAASSPAALRSALGRYAALLRHSRDAKAAGVPLDRAALRRFTADAPEQLLLWELFPGSDGPDALPLQDLARVERLRSAIDLSLLDPKVETLRSLLADGRPTLVFCNAVATVPYLRDRLVDLVPAWITGSRAGWRHVTVPRPQVLSWFRPGSPEVTPRVLLASDVAAEGLDLQRAQRVVHYDLPWTAMRLAQREGRSRRLGGAHAEVDVVRFEPPGWIERRLRIGAALRRKHLLGRRAGFDGEDSPWRWRHDLCAAWEGRPAAPGIAAVRGSADRLLVGVQAEDAPVRLAVIDAGGRWTEAPRSVRAILDRIEDAEPADGLDWDLWKSRLVPFARAVLRDAGGGRWRAAPNRAAARGLIVRLQALVRRATRARDHVALERLEPLLAFVARGHTAGEEAILDEWAALDDAALVRNGNGLPELREAVVVSSIRIVGAIAEVAGQ
jgi:hypothetical protein